MLIYQRERDSETGRAYGWIRLGPDWNPIDELVQRKESLLAL